MDRIENASAVFFLQITDSNGKVIRFNGGGAVERDIVAMLTDSIGEKMRFIQRKETRRAIIADAVEKMVYNLKQETIKVL